MLILLCVVLLATLSFQAGHLLAADAITRLESALPRQVTDCDAAHLRPLKTAVAELESEAAAATWSRVDRTSLETLAAIEQLIGSQQRVARDVQTVLALRGRFAASERRQRMRDYLAITSTLIDASGRLRYLLRDAINNATYVLDPTEGDFDRLLEILQRHEVEIGADAMAFVLFDPPADSGLRPFPDAMKKRVIKLMRTVRTRSSLADLAQFVLDEKASPELIIEAAEAIRAIGLPQDPRPKEGDSAAPPITARQLLGRLRDGRDMPQGQELAARRDHLMAWLEERAAQGAVGDSFRLGKFSVHSGDWLLMRNPSPYNLFTDLSPGLFTHVGVVTTEVGGDGIRRFVIVDLPERGDRIPATNVDAYLSRTLHYFFLRHPDPEVGERMGAAARAMIGNESQFDLLFRTHRVDQLRGKPLAGARIHTYCAGFLLICAQESGRPREEFFPITEAPAGGHCVANLETLGLSIGEQFVSPTGAIFSPRMQIVGSCEPMYDPTREIKEAIYDHFAQRMRERRLVTSPDVAQLLVEKLAHLSKTNPWLARALARANQVSEHMDLEAAAKTAAVVETLDDIANSCVDEFLQARAVIMSADLPPAEQASMTDEQRELDRRYRERHARLVDQWREQELSPLELRRRLVRFYIESGTDQLDARFFPAN